MADKQVDGEGTRPGLLELEKELVCSVLCLRPLLNQAFASNLTRYAQISYTNLSLSWTVCTHSAGPACKNGSPGRSRSVGPAEPRDSLARHVEPLFGRPDPMLQSQPSWRCFSRQTQIGKNRQKRRKKSRKNISLGVPSYQLEAPNRVTPSQMKKIGDYWKKCVK